MPARNTTLDFCLLAALTAAALLVHGYHLGIEDQGIYLPAIKKHLDPALYPYDAELFLAQTTPTLFAEVVASSIRATTFSVELAVFLWHVLSVFFFLLACLRLSRRLFEEPHAQWAGVCLVAALLTIPVTGTALYIVDQYLHPRGLATVALLLALVEAIPPRRLEKDAALTFPRPSNWLRMLAWVLVAALFHIQMAFFGTMLLLFVLWRPRRQGVPAAAALLLPWDWLWQPASDAWREAARAHAQHYLLRWHWYEWLGIVAPLALLWWFSSLGRRHGMPRMEWLSRRVALFGLFHFAVAVVVTIPARFERLTPYQPLRSLHLVYILFFLMAGGLIGRWILRKSALRWLVLFVPLSLGMFYAQRQLFPSSAHIEWPGAATQNRWLQAFAWVRQNTPKDAYFALDPHYMERPGEDYHGFRALAERSMLADYVKDSGVATLFPAVAFRWRREVRAHQSWRQFQPDDFRRLKSRFGVTWVVLEHPGVPGLACPYLNDGVRVCRIE